ALLVPADGPPVLATDSRYALAAERDCPEVELLNVRPVETALAELAAVRGLGRLAFEAQDVTVERHAALAATGGLALLVPLGHAVERLRGAKDEEELALLARACESTGQAFHPTGAQVRDDRARAGGADRARDGGRRCGETGVRHDRGQRPQRGQPAPRAGQPAP